MRQGDTLGIGTEQGAKGGLRVNAVSEMGRTLTERHVQAIWYDAALRPPNLVTRRGSEVSVLHPGDWNLGPGPDFLNAVLEVGRERRRVTGDVEVHLAPADWDFHRHGADPAYRNVIAHVTWGCGPDPRSLPPGALSIWLGRFVVGNPEFSPAQVDLAAYPFARLPGGRRPCEALLSADPEQAHEVLAEAGRHRLRMKARRILGRLCAAPFGRHQIFYEEVMTALGYCRNAIPFRRVAERLPLANWPEDVQAAKTAVLTAGAFEEWDRAANRPYNTPERRLASAAEMFSATPVMRLTDATDFSRTACRGMIAMLSGRGLMGRGRAAAIVANVVLPFALAEERVGVFPDWLPAEDLSSPVRLTAFRMFGRDHNPAAHYAGNGLLIQGLLQIYRDHCLPLYPDCERCALLAQPSMATETRSVSGSTLSRMSGDIPAQMPR